MKAVVTPRGPAGLPIENEGELSDGHIDEQVPDSQDAPRFPHLAVWSVTLALFTNNYCITSPFPYLGSLVVHLGEAKTKDEAGYMAGLLAASFMIGRTLTSLLWGCGADRYGRKPILLICCAAMFVFQLLFGFSQSFPVAFAARFLLGMSNGVVGTSKTSVAEIVPHDSTHFQSKAMGILGSAVSFGQLLGPCIGGWLADTPSQFPSTVLDTISLRQFPYLLPNVVGALFALLSGVTIYIYLPETVNRVDGRTAQNSRLVNFEPNHIILLEMTSEENQEDTSQDIAIRKNKDPESNKNIDIGPVWWRSRRVLVPCLLYAFHSMNAVWLNETFPLWCLGSVLVGGMAMSLAEIGTLATISSIFVVVFQIFAFHRFANRFGPSKVFLNSVMCLVIPVVAIPYASYIIDFDVNVVTLQNTTNAVTDLNMTQENSSTLDSQAFDVSVSTSSRIIAMAVAAILFGITSASSVAAYSAVFMMINNSCNEHQRGAVNGLAMTIASATKSVGPILGSSILAWTFNNGHKISWIFGHTFSFLLVALSWGFLYQVGKRILLRLGLDTRSVLV